MRSSAGLRQNLWSAHISSRRATVTQLYDQLVLKGIIQLNDEQRRMTEACTPLINVLRTEGSARQHELVVNAPGQMASARGHHRPAKAAWWRRAALHVASQLSPTAALDHLHTECIEPAQKRGLYLWGDVGIGKTMVLDLFDLVETDLPKRRTHLHSFMVDLTDRLVAAERALTQRRRAASTEAMRAALRPLRPIDLVVDAVLDETPILCFDEFQTFDVAHAALLSAFFTAALRKGLFLFTTSNRPPEELCNISSSFHDFLPTLYTYCNVVACGDIPDYRRRHLSEGCHDKTFMFPASKQATESLIARVEEGHRRRLSTATCAPTASVASTNTSAVAHAPWEVEWVKDDVLWHHGRPMVIPYHCGGAALFDFGDIIGSRRQDLCSADFQLLATHYHTVILTNVPQVGVLNRNVAHQFIVLVDELYQSNVKLLLTTHVPWKALLTTRRHGSGVEALDSSDHLYSEGEDDRSGYNAAYRFQNEEELMSFSRIESRLVEMGCRHYILRDHARFVVSDFDFASLIDELPPSPEKAKLGA